MHTIPLLPYAGKELFAESIREWDPCLLKRGTASKCHDTCYRNIRSGVLITMEHLRKPYSGLPQSDKFSVIVTCE